MNPVSEYGFYERIFEKFERFGFVVLYKGNGLYILHKVLTQKEYENLPEYDDYTTQGYRTTRIEITFNGIEQNIVLAKKIYELDYYYEYQYNKEKCMYFYDKENGDIDAEQLKAYNFYYLIENLIKKFSHYKPLAKYYFNELDKILLKQQAYMEQYLSFSSIESLLKLHDPERKHKTRYIKYFYNDKLEETGNEKIKS